MNANRSISALERASWLYELILGRPIDDGAREALKSDPSLAEDGFALTIQLFNSSEFLQRLVERAEDIHLFLIHRARQIMVRRLLPPASSIIDLGGINAPLFAMGYAHPFSRMVIVDLPPAERHAMYRDRKMADTSEKISIHYCDMTRLDDFADSSFDLVWSGQSIEHVEPDAAARMCREAYRVLRPGGRFCLDTPNRGITEIHTKTVGGGLIHPDHKREYRAQELKRILLDAGFGIGAAHGICEMHQTRATGTFCYQDFVLGNTITEDPDSGYILYYEAHKE